MSEGEMAAKTSEITTAKMAAGISENIW